MRFANAEVLWLLLVALPALSGFLWWAWRKKRRLIGQFVQSRLLANLTSGVSTRRQKIRLALLVAAVGLILLVLARPQWGFEWEEAKQRGLDIVIAIDTSRSMLAEDVAPNRLTRARLAALDLKKLARTDRLGLVAFAGSAFLQCPLSLDDEAFRQSVNALDVNIIPQGGTALAEAIRTAQSAFKEKTDNHKILILFTDGEDHDGQAVEAARDAAKEGLRIITVGVGTPSGELLRTTDASHRVSFLKDDQGNAVKSRLNEKLLREIAQATGEIYVPLTGANTMELIYERRLAPLPKAEFNAQRVRRFHERYQWFLALAILGLLFEMFLPERKSVRRTEEILAATTNAELRKAVALLFLILLLPAFAGASPAKALQQYDAGKFGAALREYQRLLQDKPADPRLHYNAGAAAFAAKDYDKALKHFQSALLAPDLQLQQSAFYNLGNAQFRSGEEQSEPPQKQQSWEQAVTSYESALKLNPKDADAEYNLELTKKKIEELKKQQEEQQKDQNSKDEKKDDKKDQSSKKDQKKDQKKDDKKDQKSEDQKSKSDQNQQDQKPDQKQDSQKPDPGKEQKKPDQKDQTSPQPGQKPDEEDGQPQSASLGKMTRRQAQQLLDAQKDEEKAMIFIPQIRTNRADRVFKDW